MLQTESDELDALMALVNNNHFQVFLRILDKQKEILIKRTENPATTRREADMNAGAGRLITEIKDICNAKDIKSLKARKKHNSLIRDIVESNISLIG